MMVGSFEFDNVLLFKIINGIHQENSGIRRYFSWLLLKEVVLKVLIPLLRKK